MGKHKRWSVTDSAMNGQADALLDDALADTFPASDPIAFITPLSAIMDARLQLDQLANRGDDEPIPPASSSIKRVRVREVCSEAA